MVPAAGHVCGAGPTGSAPFLIRRPAKMGSFRYFVLQVPATKGACDRAARRTILAFLLLPLP
jgi:hypothetical protein